jgi:hypothetical protein
VVQVVEAKRRLPLDDVGAAAKGLSFYDYQARPCIDQVTAPQHEEWCMSYVRPSSLYQHRHKEFFICMCSAPLDTIRPSVRLAMDVAAHDATLPQENDLHQVDFFCRLSGSSTPGRLSSRRHPMPPCWVCCQGGRRHGRSWRSHGCATFMQVCALCMHLGCAHAATGGCRW